MKMIQSLLEQTIWDVALQHYGSVEGVEYLLEDNPNCINADGVIPNGQSYRIRRNVYTDKKVVLGYEGYIPVTDGGIDTAVVLIDENGDYLFDESGDVVTSLNPNVIKLRNLNLYFINN